LCDFSCYSDGDIQPFQWAHAIGSSVFGTTSKGDVKARVTASFPPHPFAEDAVANLTAAGASHFEGIRALNRTNGDIAAAQNLYDVYVAVKLI